MGAALVGVLLCGTAACASPGGSSRGDAAGPQTLRAAPVAAVRKAADKGAALHSMSYRIDGRLGSRGNVEGKVSFSLRPRAVDMRMKTSGGAQEGEFSVRLVGDAVYVGGGERAAAALQGRHWVKFPMKGKGAGGAGGLGGMQQQADQDPAAQAALLAQSDDVKKIGQETVDGVRTTHYAGTVSVDELLKRSNAKGALSAERRERTVRRYRQLGVDALTLDLWVGPDDRTVKFRERARTGQGPLDLSIHFYDVNKPVTVQAPAASDTLDLAQRFKGREGTRI
ncbi:hypothetical protein [Streptomyces sp. NPDC048638]|uniref:hypothetical protein n=1 Tax=Streptomyces sp. NPDC048638 TaxID=3365580 RepID=UPI003721910A